MVRSAKAKQEILTETRKKKSRTELIVACARKFRVALEICDKSKLPIAFEDFPRGSCGDTSLLLAKYLKDSGCGDFDYVCGAIRENGDYQSHAWLQQDDLIVDITADQFAEIDEPVVIAEDHCWYSRFEIEHRHSADLGFYDGYTRGMLLLAYKTVLDYLHGKNSKE